MLQDITILIDNRLSHSNPYSLLKEHGLSIYFEFNRKKWLFDVGASGKFIRNAEALGIDISEVDHLIISHGHNDHGGGLRNFMSLNKKADILISDKVPGSRCFTCRKTEKREIGIDPRVFLSEPLRFKRVRQNLTIEDNIALIFTSSKKYPTPVANHTLSYARGDEESDKDDFSHEISIAINTDNGLIILSACSHAGVQNIIDSSCTFWNNQKVLRFIGGTHLVDGDFETEADIRLLAREIRKNHPSLELYTGHCTGDNALKILSDEMQDHLFPFYAGMIIPPPNI